MMGDSPVFPAFETFVGEIVRSYDVDAFAEWENFYSLPCAVPDALSQLKYEEFVNKRLAGCTHLRKLVNSIMNAAATEASVERAFSTMRRVFTYCRGRLSDASVEAVVIAASYQDPPNLESPSPSPRTARRPRKENTEQPINVDDVAAQVDDDVVPFFLYIYENWQAQSESEEEDEPQEAAPERRRLTRLQNAAPPAVRCSICKRTMDTHEVRWYVQCAVGCGLRASLSCTHAGRLSRMSPELRALNECKMYPMAKDFQWRCPQHAN
jgi:hypothetical protein